MNIECIAQCQKTPMLLLPFTSLPASLEATEIFICTINCSENYGMYFFFKKQYIQHETKVILNTRSEKKCNICWVFGVIVYFCGYMKSLSQSLAYTSNPQLWSPVNNEPQKYRCKHSLMEDGSKQILNLSLMQQTTRPKSEIHQMDDSFDLQPKICNPLGCLHFLKQKWNMFVLTGVYCRIT